MRHGRGEWAGQVVISDPFCGGLGWADIRFSVRRNFVKCG
jgi:hypothetical protein